MLDGVLQINSLLEQDTALLNRVILFKDSIISIKNSNITTYNSVITDYQGKENLYKNNLKSSERSVKWLKLQRTVLGALFISSLVYLAVGQNP